MLRMVLILLLVFPIAGCAFGPEERPEKDMREQSMDWPSMRPSIAVEKDTGPRPTQEQR